MPICQALNMRHQSSACHSCLLPRCSGILSNSDLHNVMGSEGVGFFNKIMQFWAPPCFGQNKCFELNKICKFSCSFDKNGKNENLLFSPLQIVIFLLMIHDCSFEYSFACQLRSFYTYSASLKFMNNDAVVKGRGTFLFY